MMPAPMIEAMLRWPHHGWAADRCNHRLSQESRPPGAYGGPAAYPPDQGAPYGRDQWGRPLSDKSKLVAGLLQIFLGSFGVGRFYTGHTGMALAMLFTCGGLGVWALVDGILLLVKNDWTDARGLYLRP